MLSLVSEIARFLGSAMGIGIANRKKSLRFRCAKTSGERRPWLAGHHGYLRPPNPLISRCSRKSVKKLSKTVPHQSLVKRSIYFTCCHRVGDLQKGSAERGFPDLFWFLLKTNRNKSEENGTNRNKSEEIGVFPKTRSANRNKSEENGEIGTNRGDPLLLTPNWGLRSHGSRPSSQKGHSGSLRVSDHLSLSPSPLGPLKLSGGLSKADNLVRSLVRVSLFPGFSLRHVSTKSAGTNPKNLARLFWTWKGIIIIQVNSNSLEIPCKISGRRIGNIAVGRGIVNSSFLRIQVISP